MVKSFAQFWPGKARFALVALATALFAAVTMVEGPGVAAPAFASTPGGPAAVAQSGPASFDPEELLRLGGTAAVMALGTNNCGGRLCPQLWRISAGGRSVGRLTPPPGSRATGPGLVRGTGNLVFANGRDGYSVGQVGAVGNGARSFFTSDGARTWAPLPPGLSGSLSDVVATRTSFYGLISECAAADGLEYCSDRLGRSPVSRPDWTSVAIPGAEDLLAGYLSLAVHGHEIWIYIDQQEAGAVPVILKSVNGRSPFSKLAEPDLVSVVSCGVALMTTSAAWVTCPTGMMVSWWRTTDGGQHFTHWWETSGTGGVAFDPLTATVAYRYTGDVGPGPAHVLQRTTDGGAKYVTVTHLSFDGGSQVQMAFENDRDGYVLGWESRPADVENGHAVLLFTADGGREWHAVFGRPFKRTSTG